MNRTFLKYMSAVACLAAASPGVPAQSDGPVEVHVVRVQDPKAGPPVEKQLVEVIDLLGTEKMTEARQEQARKVLQELVERLRHDQKSGVASGRWVEAREKDAQEVEGFEIGGELMEGAETPGVTHRARVLHLKGEDGEPIVVRGRVIGVDPREPEAAKAPKPPRAPKAPRARKVPGVVQWKAVAPQDGGAVEILEGDGGEHVLMQLKEVHHGVLDRVVHDKAAKERLHRIIARVHASDDDTADVDAADDEDATQAVAQRHMARVLRIAHEEKGDGNAAKAHGQVKLLLEQKLAEADERRAVARSRTDRLQRVQVERLDDVTEDEGDLRTMMDEMRAEMREVRALMQKIREQAPAAEAVAPTQPMRLMR